MENKYPIGQKINLPGHFNETVTLEAVREIFDGYELRVRLSNGSLEEAILSSEEATIILGEPEEKPRAELADAEKIRLLIESARIRLAYAHDSQFAVSISGNHGVGYRSYYLHLKKPEIKSLQKVKRGQIIGYPDERWNIPRLVFRDYNDQCDPNNYGMNHSFMNYWDGKTDLTIGKAEQNKRFELQQQILNKFAGMVEGPEKYTLLRKKHKGGFSCKWSPIEKFRYIEYLLHNKPETFPSLTKEQFGEMKKEFYSNQPIILTLPFKKG